MDVSEKQLHHVGHARSSGHVYRRLPADVGVLQVGPRRQELHHVPVALPDGDVDGQGAALVRDVHRRAVLHQDLKSVQEPRPGRVVDRSDAVFVLQVRVGSFLQQQAGDLWVPHHHHLEETEEDETQDRKLRPLTFVPAALFNVWNFEQ